MANKKVSQLTSKPSVLTTDLFPIADPSTGQLYKTTISDLGTAIGSGVSSVNGLVGAVVLDTDDIQELVSPTNKWFTDTRARAALSASSPLAYNSGTGVFSIPAATSSQNGYLTSTDWTTFNAKQAALSGTGFVKISGTTISYDNSTYLTTSAAASTYLALAGGTLTGALNGTSANFSGDLTLTGTNPRFYLTDSDNNPDYFISNTDGTFTVYDVTNSTSRFTIGTTGNANFTNAITGGGSITGQSIYSNGIVSVGTYLLLPVNNTVGGTNYYIGQAMADNDYWRIYGNTIASDQGELVFHIGDNAQSSSTNGQRFRFYYDNVSGGTAKDALVIDYNTSTFTTTLVATGATLSGALSGTSATFSSSLTSAGLLLNTGVYLGSRSLRAASDLLILYGGTAGFNFTDHTNSTVLASISNSGAATFSSSVTATKAILNGSSATSSVAFLEVFGSTTASTNNGQIRINDSITTSKTLSIGVDGANNLAFLQSFQDGVAYRNLILNGLGGRIIVGATTDGATGLVQIHGTARAVQLVASQGGITAGNYTVYSHDDDNGYINTVRQVNTGDFNFRFDGTNKATINRTTGAYVATSDFNKKKDIELSTIGLYEIMQLKPSLYRMIEDKTNGQKELGFIAQEVREFIPNAFVQSGDFIGLNFNPIVAALTKAVQELKAELDTLKNK